MCRFKNGLLLLALIVRLEFNNKNRYVIFKFILLVTGRFAKVILSANRSFRQSVSSLTTSSLNLKSIRQRLIEGTINTVNRSLCNYTRNQSNTFTAWLEICDRFNGQFVDI